MNSMAISYRQGQTPNCPVVFLSVFKSGTEMMKRIIEDLTGLPPMEPEIIPGKVNYQDSAQLYFREGHFYAWHLFPTHEVQQKLIQAQAKPVFLLRNIYDVVVSMYYHFANNIDADVGRGRNVDHYFQTISKEEGLSCIVEGMLKPDFVWKGAGPHYHQMELMLQFSEIYPCFITTYEKMHHDKLSEIQKLADFLEIPLSNEKAQDVAHSSYFDVMKAAAERENIGSHFRRGRPGSHADELNVNHVRQIQHILKQHAPYLSDLLQKADLSHISEQVISS